MTKLPAWCTTGFLVLQNKKELLLQLLSVQNEGGTAATLHAQANLLWLYRDDAAYHTYHHAAQLYRQENNLRAALAVYQQLQALQPTDKEVVLPLIFVALELCDAACVTAQLTELNKRGENGKISKEEAVHIQQQVIKRCELLARQGIAHAPTAEELSL
ncbi:MAG: hypothetical protein PVJ92_01150 [Candidatus Dependentiae bacterium]|jgi:hypothetical protein